MHLSMVCSGCGVGRRGGGGGGGGVEAGNPLEI